jgi:hypothetical protein
MTSNVLDFIEHSLKDKKNKANHKILKDLVELDGKISDLMNDFIVEHKNGREARSLLFMIMTLKAEAVSEGLTFEQEMACLSALAAYENN